MIQKYDMSVLMFSHRPEESKREQYIRESIESLRAQEGLNIQAVILDDGSFNELPTDLISNTSNIYIEYIHYKENQGKHKMMDIGLPMMKAGIMTTLHDDDLLISSDSLLKRFNFFNAKSNTAMIFTNAIYNDEVKKEVFTLYPPKKKISHSHKKLLKKNYISGATYAIRTDLKQRLRAHPSLEHAEEYDIWLQVSKYAYQNKMSIRYTPEITALYRMHGEQTWNTVRNMSAKEKNEQYLDFIRTRNKL